MSARVACQASKVAWQDIVEFSHLWEAETREASARKSALAQHPDALAADRALHNLSHRPREAVRRQNEATLIFKAAMSTRVRSPAPPPSYLDDSLELGHPHEANAVPQALQGAQGPVCLGNAPDTNDKNHGC